MGVQLEEAKTERFSTRLTPTQMTDLRILGARFAPQFIKLGRKEYYTDAEYFEALLAYAKKAAALSDLSDLEAERLKKIPIINSKLTTV